MGVFLTRTSIVAGGGAGFIPQSGFESSGTWSEDGSVTITRGAGGFGTKPNDPKPLLWMPFKTSATPSSLGRVTSAREADHFTFSASGGADGNGHYAGDTSDGGTADNLWTLRLDSDSWGSSTYDWNSYDQKIFISRRVYKNFGDLNAAGDYNVKDIRFWGRDGSTPDGGNIRAPSAYLSRSNGAFGEENMPNIPYIDFDWDHSNYGTNRADCGSIQNRWYDEETVIKINSEATNTGDTTDQEYKLCVDGGDYDLERPWTTYSDWSLRWHNATGDANDGRMRVMYPVHYVVDTGTGSRPSAPNGSYYLIDDLYVDDSWARIVIGDSATYTSCTYRRLQPPSAWSDTAVTFTVQSGGITLSGKHVFIVTNADTPIYAGQIA